EPLAGQLGDLSLLRRQLVARVGGPLADGLPRRQQLATSAFREGVHSGRGEIVESDAELGTRVDAAVGPSQPFPIQEPGAGELGSNPGSAQMVDGLEELALGTRVVAEQGPRTRVDPE